MASPNLLMSVEENDEAFYCPPTETASSAADTSNSSLEDFKNGIRDIFCRWVVPPIEKATCQLLPSTLAPNRGMQIVGIDGVIETYEEGRLWYMASEITARFVMDPDSNVTKNSVAYGLMLDLLFEDGSLEPDGNPPITELLEHAQRKTTGVEKIILQYALSELMAATNRGRPLSATLSKPEEALTDISEDPDFQSFAAGLKFLPQGSLGQITARPVARIESHPQAPVLFVYLDEHTDFPIQTSILRDWINLSRHNPFYSVEGTYLGGLEDGVLKRRTEKALTIARENLKKPKEELRSIANSHDALVEVPYTLQLCNSIDFGHREMALMNIPYIPFISKGRDQRFFNYAHECLYHGALALHGWEDKVSRDLDPKDIADLSLDNFVDTYRSIKAHDNTLFQMQRASLAFGIIKIGLAHYPSLSMHSYETGRANVIFLMPDAKPSGPWPSLPNQCEG